MVPGEKELQRLNSDTPWVPRDLLVCLRPVFLKLVQDPRVSQEFLNLPFGFDF